jgi:phosphonoacetaldehyde hydrolase
MSRLKAVILDWAGTAVDAGSLAPLRTIQKVFARHGIAVTEAQARKDMGLAKREHIRRLLAVIAPSATESDGDAFYAEFIPAQMEILAEYSTLIPGVREAVERMRARGLRIGSTTGYTREMLDLLVERAREQGYVPDCSITPQEAGGGRPHPYMIYLAAIRMQTYPLNAFVKIGDTPSDIEEGRNAGTWTVGVAGTGNSSREELAEAKPHYIVNSVAEIDSVLDAIEGDMNDRE